MLSSKRGYLSNSQRTELFRCGALTTEDMDVIFKKCEVKKVRCPSLMVKTARRLQSASTYIDVPD